MNCVAVMVKIIVYCELCCSHGEDYICCVAVMVKIIVYCELCSSHCEDYFALWLW